MPRTLRRTPRQPRNTPDTWPQARPSVKRPRSSGERRVVVELPWLGRWQPQLLALLRIFTALLFLEHATQKFFAFPAPFPMPGPLPPVLIAAGVVELVAGVLITI